MDFKKLAEDQRRHKEALARGEYRTIIAGSRGITDYLTVPVAVILSKFNIIEVVSGGARGVDRLGEAWADKHHIEIKRFIPDWDNEGKAAGFNRNKRMAWYADALIAIWDGESRGTKHMIDTMRDHEKPVYVHRVKNV